MKIILVWVFIQIGAPFGVEVRYTDMSDMASCEQYRHELEFTAETYLGGYCTEIPYEKEI